MKNRLLIVWSSGEKEVATKLILLYGSVMLPRSYWDEATIMVWGAIRKTFSTRQRTTRKNASSKRNRSAV